MSSPIQVSSDLLTQRTGYSADQWRHAALRASEALQANPQDSEAANQLASARMVLRQHVGTLGEATALTNAQRPGVGTTAGRVMAFGQGAGGGFTDEIAGLASAAAAHPLRAIGASIAAPVSPIASLFMLSGTPEGRAGAEAHRQTLQTAREQDPTGTLVADIGGSVAGGVVTGSMLNKALPFLPRVFAAATEPITNTSGILRHIAPAAAATATGAAETGLAVGTRAAGESDGGLGERATNAAVGFGAGALIGVPLSAGAVAAGTMGRTMLQGFRNARSAAPAAQVAPQAPANAVGGPQAQVERAARMLHPNDPAKQQEVIQRTLRRGVSETESGKVVLGRQPPPPPQPVQEAGEAVLPGQALHDVAGNPIPGTIRPTMPLGVNPEESARAAYNQVLQSTGDTKLATEAARRSAAMARAAMPEAQATPLQDELMLSVRLSNIVKNPPTESAQRELLQFLSGVSPDMQRRAQNMLPRAWLDVLGL